MRAPRPGLPLIRLRELVAEVAALTFVSLIESRFERFERFVSLIESRFERFERSMFTRFGRVGVVESEYLWCIMCDGASCGFSQGFMFGHYSSAAC